MQMVTGYDLLDHCPIVKLYPGVATRTKSGRLQIDGGGLILEKCFAEFYGGWSRDGGAEGQLAWYAPPLCGMLCTLFGMRLVTGQDRRQACCHGRNWICGVLWSVSSKAGARGVG